MDVAAVSLLLLLLLLCGLLVLPGTRCSAPTTASSRPGSRSGPFIKHQNSLMTSVQSSLNNLLKSLGEDPTAPALDLHLAQRVDALNRQVTSLSAELTAVGTKLDSMTKTTIQISKNLMEATSTNTENLAKLGEKLDYLALIQGTQKAAELAESEEQKKTEQRNKMLYFAIRKLSHNNKATIAALSQMSHRVNDLERYASPMDGALVNASAMIGKNFEQIYSRLEMMAENQATFISVVKRAMTTVTRKINNNTERLDQKQKQFVIETSSVYVTGVSLTTANTISFKKKFTKVPEVSVAISGFAMAPDQASAGPGVNASSARSMNFYALSIEIISNVTTSGFNFTLNDRRNLGYGAFEWVKMEYIAIGE